MGRRLIGFNPGIFQLLKEFICDILKIANTDKVDSYLRIALITTQDHVGGYLSARTSCLSINVAGNVLLQSIYIFAKSCSVVAVPRCFFVS